MTTPSTTSRNWDRAILFSFFAVLWTPLIVTLATPGSEISASEQRILAKRPAIPSDAASLRDFPDAFETWYDDRVGLRDDMIRVFAWLHIELLGLSSSERLIVGRDGWFFFGDENAIAQVRGTARLTERELAEWAHQLALRRDWLRGQGIAYLVVFVPNKHRMYAENLPASLPRWKEVSTLDQLSGYLEIESDVPVLDLREDLVKAAAELRTYHKTDTHWNDHGAYAGYAAILRSASALLPEYAPFTPVPVRRVDRTTPGLGLPRIVGLSRAYPELSYDFVVREPRAAIPPNRRAAHAERAERRLPFALGTGDPSQPTAVMFRDSFANALVPYLSESFRRVVYFWLTDIDPAAIEFEKPTIVIHEIAEQFLGPPPGDFASVLARRAR